MRWPWRECRLRSGTHDSSLVIRATGRKRTYAACCQNARIFLLRATNRRGEPHERATDEHHRGFITHPRALPRNCRHGDRRGHRRTGRIGLAGADCWRRCNEPQNRQRQIPPTHKVAPHSPLCLCRQNTTGRRLDKLQSLCHAVDCRIMDKRPRSSDVAQYSLRSGHAVTQMFPNVFPQ